MRRLELATTLGEGATREDGHKGCVNTVQWNNSGSLLVSSGDDKQIKIWSYPRRRLRQSVSSGHILNVFCAKFMPQTGDSQLVSCAADHNIRWFDLPSEQARTVHCHANRVKKLACERSNPHVFLSCSEDCTVRQHDLRAAHSCSADSCSNVLVDLRGGVRAPHGNDLVSSSRTRVLSISLHPEHPHILAVGGSDPVVRVYDRRQLSASAEPTHRLVPSALADRWHGLRSVPPHITGVSFGATGRRLLASYSHEQIYLFDIDPSKPVSAAAERMLRSSRLHTSCHHPRPSTRQPARNVRARRDHGAPLAPSLSAARPARMARMWTEDLSEDEDTSDDDGEDLSAAEGTNDNDQPGRSGNDDDDSTSDSRVQACVEQQAERRRADVEGDSGWVRQFRGHCNMRTVKEVNFFGPLDQYVMSGSDDGQIFMWDAETAEIVQLLDGDNDVVNCLVGHPVDCVLASR